jgi:hypothetical protein
MPTCARTNVLACLRACEQNVPCREIPCAPDPSVFDSSCSPPASSSECMRKPELTRSTFTAILQMGSILTAAKSRGLVTSPRSFHMAEGNRRVSGAGVKHRLLRICTHAGRSTGGDLVGLCCCRCSTGNRGGERQGQRRVGIAKKL